MFTCADCQRTFVGRSYGRQKYGLTLCSRCFVQRNEADNPAKRAHRLQTMQAYFQRKHPRTPVLKPRKQPLQGHSGTWQDPVVQAHHAAMLRKYFERSPE